MTTPSPRTATADPAALADAVHAGDRAALARAITLLESRRDDHRAQAGEVLARLMPHTGAGERLGVSGVPGAGKSTFIEAFGLRLADEGRRVAVLAVDPSSAVSGGSILGDKTRMQRLANHPAAFIRPSPSAGTLGGVAARTRETILLCEAAGFDAVIVETVGVGQSEAVVAGMVDFFVVLALAGAGDELQGIKRGVLELADLVAVNKADGDGLRRAEEAARALRAALSVVAPRDPSWRTPVLTCSALTGAGLAEIADAIRAHHEAGEASGAREERRRAQRVRWLWEAVEDGLLSALRAHPAVAARQVALEAAVRDGRTPATVAARELLDAFVGARADAGLTEPKGRAARPA